MVLSIGDFAALAGLFLVMAGLMGGMLKIMVGQLNASIAASHARIDKIEHRVERIDKEKVGKDDWIRVVVSHTNRNFAMSRHIAALNGKIDGLLAQHGVPTKSDDEATYPHDYAGQEQKR